MGVVYLAEHPVIGKKVAMKAIHPELSRNAEVVSRFVTEAKSVNQIGHEHIVDISDFGNTPDGEFYFVMEYLQGESMADRLKRERILPPARGAQHRRPGRRRAGRLARARHHPSRSQAREHLPRLARREQGLRQGAGLRSGQADPGRGEGHPQDAHRFGDGNALLHVARAVRGARRPSITAPISIRWA